MKKIAILLAAFAVSGSALAVGPSGISFVAPAVVPATPSLAKLSDVNAAIHGIGTAFNLNSNDPANAALDTSMTNLVLSVKIQNIDTSTIAVPTFSGGVLTLANNFADSVSTVSKWVQIDQSGYDTAALAYRDQAGAYAVTAMTTGDSGFNKLLSTIDGTVRTVNNADYTATVSYNGLISAFNGASDVATKQSTLTQVVDALSVIQAQASAIDTASAAVVVSMNSYILPTAAANSASYSGLPALLTYTGLQ